MDLLTPSLQKTVHLKISLENCSSHSTDSNDQPQLNNTKSQEETRIPTSATSSKSLESMDISPITDPSTHVQTKGDAAGAKDITNCFCCFWIFPQSFRGEEKNMHIDRCMEGLGDKDKRFWAKCSGDLKQYRHNFDGFMWGTLPKPKTSKPKREKASADQNLKDVDQSDQPLPKKKTSKKDDINGNTKEGKKEIQKSKDDDSIDNLEVQVNKKYKTNDQKAKETKIDKGGQITVQTSGTGYTKIIAIPLVNKLIFNPSKEFEKLLKK